MWVAEEGGGAPTPSGPHAACHANLGGALTWVVLTREEAGGRNRASCHAFQSASGWQVKSASWSLKPGHGMPIFGREPQDQSKHDLIIMYHMRMMILKIYEDQNSC